MLYTNFHIIDAKYSVDCNLDEKDGIIAFITGTGNLEDTYQKLDTISNGLKYCLLIDDNANIDQRTAEHIIPFFFLTGYFNYQGQPKILIKSMDAAVNQNTSNVIIECAIKQGFEKIDIQFLNERDTPVFYFGRQEKQIADVYSNLLNNTDLSVSALFIQVEKVNQIEASNALLNEAEQQLRLNNPVLFELKNNARQYGEELYRMGVLLQSAEQELGNQRSHAAILRSDSMASQLQRYYNNEYEILPVWFKKLGQIIKMISGKRSLRSAFDKNRKKYKD